MTTPADRSDDSRGLRHAFATFSGEPPLGNCPEADAIWAALRGGASPAQTRAIVLHTAACSPCAEAWRIAHAALADTPVTVAAAPAWRSVWVWGPGLAAAALLVISVLNNSGVSLPRSRPSLQLRESPSPLVSTLVPDGDPLDRQAFVLRWSPGPEGAQYNLRVTREDLTVITHVWSLDRPSYRIPPDLLAALPAGTRLLWQVDVLVRDQPTRTSQTFTVRVR